MSEGFFAVGWTLSPDPEQDPHAVKRVFGSTQPTEHAAREALQKEHADLDIGTVETFPSGNDVCGYCVHDNGPVDPKTGRGVSRQGFDCYWCGSN